VRAIGKVFHADVTALFTAKAHELAHQHCRRLPGDGRDRAVGHASAIFPMAGRTRAIQLFTANEVRRRGTGSRELRSRLRGLRKQRQHPREKHPTGDRALVHASLQRRFDSWRLGR
jgi:hypothetical protein